MHAHRAAAVQVQVLAALLARPGKAALYGRLAWALGRGVGEYLLQQAQWVLQVEGPQDTTSFSLLSCPARHACKSGSS